MKALNLIVASLVAWAGIASAVTILTTVTGNQGPWDGGLNPAYQFDFGASTAPTVISATDGLNFSAGLSLSISYASGLVSVGPGSGWPFTDANGYTTYIPLNNSSWGEVGPSYYMNPATYPIYVSELVGTFANSSGQIVGTPFAVGNMGTFTIPVGATRLQLGVNDVGYGDNSGSWSIQITQVPEPSTWSLLLLGVVGLLGKMLLRRR